MRERARQRWISWTIVLAASAVWAASPRDGGTAHGPNEAERACATVGDGVNLLADRPGRAVSERWKSLVAPDAGDVAWSPVWTTARGDWAAAIVWAGGTTARLVLIHEQRDGGVALEAGELEAGWSDRYSEAYAPELLSTPVIVQGRPFPLVTATSMGGGGGGGSHLMVVVPADGGLREQMLGSLSGCTNINSDAVVGEGACVDALRAHRLDDGTTLLLEECFDGKKSTQRCFRWNGTSFVERARAFLR